ncbi:MAG: glycerol-3-phosphate acyltransferase [Actinomycetota bacterium]|nr:glycerol-3-phosphate acyltransferase [Actinomycetota bacterium]
MIGLSWVAGSFPFSFLAARAVRGVDLRKVGNGTVSGTSLYQVAGFGPLAVAGILEVAKGAVGPLVARGRPRLSALSAAAALLGHNWSPWLRGAGGRGLSPALGATLVQAPEAALWLLIGLTGGRLLRMTGLGSALAIVTLPLPLRRRGAQGQVLAAALMAPMMAKRLTGNGRPARRNVRTYLSRLAFDHDPA